MVQFGLLKVPPDWEELRQVTFLEPQAYPASELLNQADVAVGAAPRANIHMVRKATEEGKTLEQIQEEFIGQSFETFPEMLELSRGKVSFDDGVEGAEVTIIFDGPSGVRAIQRHLFRVDADEQVQIVMTVEESRRSDIDSLLSPIALSFRP